MRRNNRLPSLGFALFCLTVWARLAAGQPAATITHAFCSAIFGGATYFSAAFSAPFEKDPRGADPSYHTMVTWGAAFGDYVAEKYGGTKGSTAGSCSLAASLEHAQAALKGRIATAKRLMQKVVETDWVYKSATPPPPQSPAPATSAAQTPPAPNANAQGTTVHVWCSSDPNGPVIYFSQVFDTGLGRPDQGVNMFSPIAAEFQQYLKGRYDYKSSANYKTGCGGSLSQGQMSASRSSLIASYGTGKSVVELEWAWALDTSEVPRGVTIPQDGGYCTTSGSSGTVYMAGPFDLKGQMATYDWNRAFSQFLASKYGFKGEANCDIGMQRFRARRYYSFHIQGARAGNRKVVETGWELGAAAPAPSGQAAQPNDTRPAAPAATPSQQARDFATKDAQEAHTYCNQDRALYRGLDCQKVHRAVYNYRMAHAADATPEPLATLLNDKLDCSSCADNMRTPAWAKQEAHGAGNKPAVSECVEQRIMAAFLAKPYVTRLKEAYNATLAACKR